MNRASRRSTRRAGGLAGVSLIATTGLLGSYVGGLRLPHAQAATFQVTTTDDTGAGSLRQAIIDANNNAGADIITISATGTLTLQSALPEIEQDLTITGPGAEQFTIDADNQFRAFTALDQDLVLQVSDLTITDGRTFRGGAIDVRGSGDLQSLSLAVDGVTFSGNKGTNYGGGGIYASDAAALTITDSVFTGNKGYGGGAIVAARVAALSISDSHFDANQGYGRSGAIHAYQVRSATIERSLFTANYGRFRAGAINMNDGDLTVADSQFVGNQTNYFGGAIDKTGGSDDLIVTGSTFSANQATNSNGNGGAIHSRGTTRLVNSTFTANSAGNRGGAVFGGAAESDPLTLSFVTVTGNQSVNGGAIFVQNVGAVVEDSIVQGNTVTNAGYPGSPGADVSGEGTVSASRSLFTSQADSSVSAAGAAVTWDPADGNQFTADPVVGPLSDNGGFTLPDGNQILTMRPLADSPVLDAVPAAPGQPDYDQRGTGFPRVTAGTADIGAVEFVVPTPPPSPSPSPTQTTSPSPSPSGSPTPTPTPSPTPTTKPTTDLSVQSRAAGNRIRADRRTTLVFQVRTDGTVNRVRASCELQGQPLRKALQDRLCGMQVRQPDATAASDTRRVPVRVTTDPTCSTGLRFRVTLTAKAEGERPTTWSRTWRGSKGDPCRIPGTG